MSKSAARLIAGFGRLATLVLKPSRRAACRATAAAFLIDKIPVKTPNGDLLMYCNSRQAARFPHIYMTHEPDTLAWIDTMPEGAVLWDIGANVGMYALYAGLAGHRVLAFEPASSTYFTLIKNLQINGLLDTVEAYCLAFNDETRLGRLNMNDNISGSAIHAFEDDTHSGDEKSTSGLAHPAVGLSIDDFVGVFNPVLPTHIKLDVDSTEQKILAGARTLLSGHAVRSVWVEVEGALDRERNRKIISELHATGYVPKDGTTRTRNLEFVPAS